MNSRRLLTMAILIAGIGLRLRQYLANRSLWLDECFLALNLRERGFAGLLQPLDYGQAAPIGFLWGEKFAVLQFGDSELSLRLLPLVAGVMVLPLFWLLARHCVQLRAAVLATSLLAVSEFLVYYSSEVKQYSTDVLVTVVLLLLGHRVHRGLKPNGSPRGWGPLAAVGAALIWCSHTSIFTLPSILAALALSTRRTNRRHLGPIVVTAALWGVSLLFNYLVSLRHIAGSAHLSGYWKSAFIRLPPLSLPELRAIIEVLLRFFQDPAGLTLVGLSAFCVIVGATSLWRRDRPLAMMLQMPAWLVLAASSMGRYPFEGRLLLFLVAPALLLLAQGAEEIRSLLWERSRLAGICLVVAVVYHPLVHAYDYARHPRLRQELRPVLKAVAARRAPEHLVYVNAPSQWGYAYYAPRVGLQAAPHVIGTFHDDDPASIRSELSALFGRGSVWFVFSHVATTAGTDERGPYLDYLETIGRRVSQVEEYGASAYLYELPPKDEAPARVWEAKPSIGLTVPEVVGATPK